MWRSGETEGVAVCAILTFLLGWEFDEDPVQPWVPGALCSSLDAKEVAKALYEAAMKQVQAALAPLLDKKKGD